MPSQLRTHVEMLAGTIGERNIWQPGSMTRAAIYIREAFERAGYMVRAQAFQVQGRHVENLEATLSGTSDPNSIVVVGAHYDTVMGCPGANDNGTGMAATLELARRFARMPRAGTIRFVAFANEEPPFFQTDAMGSVVYAQAAKERGDNITAMLSLETIGYYSDVPGSQQYPSPLDLIFPKVGNFIGFVSNLASAKLLRCAQRAFKDRTSFPIHAAPAPESIPGVGWSDQWAFWRAGYHALMVTDTAPYRYPWYHTPEDTPDKIDYERFEEVVDGLEHVVHGLAEQGGRRQMAGVR